MKPGDQIPKVRAIRAEQHRRLKSLADALGTSIEDRQGAVALCLRLAEIFLPGFRYAESRKKGKPREWCYNDLKRLEVLVSEYRKRNPKQLVSDALAHLSRIKAFKDKNGNPRTLEALNSVWRRERSVIEMFGMIRTREREPE